MSATALPSDVCEQYDVAFDLPQASGIRARGIVNVSSACRDGATFRNHVHESGALRVRFPHEERPGLTGVVVNTGGGMTGGDAFSISASAGPGSVLTMTTSAAEKLYRSTGESAHLHVALSAQENSSLAWLPQEAILFDGARVKRNYEVDIAPGATAFLCDINCIGRSAMGEKVTDLKLQDQWRIRIGGQLVYADNMRIDGNAFQILARPSVADGANSFATLVFAGQDADSASAYLRALFSAREDVRGGAGLYNGICVARLVAAELQNLRSTIVAASQHLCDAAMPRSWAT